MCGNTILYSAKATKLARAQDTTPRAKIRGDYLAAVQSSLNLLVRWFIADRSEQVSAACSLLTAYSGAIFSRF